MRTPLATLIASIFVLTACSAETPTEQATSSSTAQTASVNNQADQEVWIDLFNGNDMSDWTPKFRGFAAGENYLDTFRVEDGLLVARYDNYEKFDSRFGHLWSNQGPFSYYILEAEYRFVGDQVNEGPEWARRNNGLMYHAQPVETMALEQDFPLSIEYQLLGGDGENERTTANLCTPGTHVVIDGVLREDHCIVSSSKTMHGDQWVTVRAVVHGSELAQHYVNGEKVMEYTNLQQDDGTPRDSGYITIQAESHPTDFKKIRLLNLKGCMDIKALNYKSYFIKDDPSACQYQ